MRSPRLRRRCPKWVHPSRGENLLLCSPRICCRATFMGSINDFRGGDKTLTRWEEFHRLLRWEEPVQMPSALPVSEAIASLQGLTLPPGNWRNYVPFANKKPLIGNVVGHRGLLTCRDKWPRASCGRALKFSVDPVESGSVLTGTLELRLSLYVYEWAVICGAIFMEIAMIYGMVASRSPINGSRVLDLLRPLLFAPFLWCYVRIGLWFGRKREAELLSQVRNALIRKPPMSVRTPRPSSPTESSSGRATL